MVTELQGIIGFEGLGINAWLVWILPFVGASLMPAIAKAGKRVRDYAAVGFALASAISAVTLLPLGIHGGQIHSQINWIPMLNIHAGTLADSLSILMANIVAWISLLIFIYSIGYMHGDRNLTRYWFFMLFFIGSMQLIVLSDNLLMVFFGWEGVGLASFALIQLLVSRQEKGLCWNPWTLCWRNTNVGITNTCRTKSIFDDEGWRYHDALRHVLDFWICRHFWLY